MFFDDEGNKRSDNKEIGLAIKRYMRQAAKIRRLPEGFRPVASKRDIKKNLKYYAELTEADCRLSISRPKETNAETQIPNVARNQNLDPIYANYQPLEDCEDLEYRTGIGFILHPYPVHPPPAVEGHDVLYVNGQGVISPEPLSWWATQLAKQQQFIEASRRKLNW